MISVTSIHDCICICIPFFNCLQLSRKSASRSGRKSRSQQAQGLQLRVARLGHPARVSPVTQPYCLDSLIARDDGSEIVADVRKDIDKLQKELAKRGKRYDRAQRREMQAEMRVLRKEVRKREEAVVREIMQSRQVILCTCTTASSRLIITTTPRPCRLTGCQNKKAGILMTATITSP